MFSADGPPLINLNVANTKSTTGPERGGGSPSANAGWTAPVAPIVTAMTTAPAPHHNLLNIDTSLISLTSIPPCRSVSRQVFPRPDAPGISEIMESRGLGAG